MEAGRIDPVQSSHSLKWLLEGGGGFENINENNQLLNLSFFLYHNLLTEKSNFLIVDLTIFIRLEYMVNYLL